MSSFVSNLCVFVTLLFNCGIQFEASRGRYRGGPVRQGHCPVGNRSRRILLLPPRDAGLLPPHRSAAFRPCHYPHLFRTHISTSTWYSKTPGKPRELGLPPSTDGVHALSAKSCATARRSRAADHRFVKRSGIMTYIISLTQQTLQKMWVMTRPLGCAPMRWWQCQDAPNRSRPWSQLPTSPPTNHRPAGAFLIPSARARLFWASV
jgi:hypothetical protein